MFRADLHCHSTCSDGSLTPVELVRQAKETGLSGLSITDHDTIEAYQTAPQEAKKCGIFLGTGAEFSASYKKESIHILAYDFSLESEVLNDFCKKHELRRKKRNERILAKLKKYRMPVEIEELEKTFPKAKTIGRPHIAKLMIDKGYVKTIKEAFSHYLGDGKCCYDAEETFSVEETIRVIHEAEGKAFLAHPHLLRSSKLLTQLLVFPFDGIECHYGKFTPQEEGRWVSLAKEKNLLISGGSDFHGDDKTYLPLGTSWIDEECFNKIFTRGK
jgi:predicted metal-dependent phosphoesterase TrpH